MRFVSLTPGQCNEFTQNQCVWGGINNEGSQNPGRTPNGDQFSRQNTHCADVLTAPKEAAHSIRPRVRRSGQNGHKTEGPRGEPLPSHGHIDANTVPASPDPPAATLNSLSHTCPVGNLLGPEMLGTLHTSL